MSYYCNWDEWMFALVLGRHFHKDRCKARRNKKIAIKIGRELRNVINASTANPMYLVHMIVNGITLF